MKRVLFLDGEYDWMSPEIPQALVNDKKLPEGSEVVFIPDAGHQLFLDNPDGFNAAVLKTMQ
jgi:pimeloyl-ACP methyl ester carboxylesterase